MADKPGEEAKDTGQKTIFNSGIGDDWGEAFEVESFIAASPEEESRAEFFLPDEAVETVVDIPVEAGAQAEAVGPSTFGRFYDIRQRCIARFRTIPVPFRIAALAAVPLLALSLFFVLPEKPQQIVPEPEVQSETVPAVQSEPSVVHLSEAETETHAEAQPPPPVEAKIPEPVASEVKMLRKKWRFPAIIVHAKTDQDHGSAIISTDLTLILKLAPGDLPPADKDSFVREVLYQFYANQPIDDLQRYALERGDMNRKLQAWIGKQWPDLPLDSVAVDRYQLL